METNRVREKNWRARRRYESRIKINLTDVFAHSTLPVKYLYALVVTKSVSHLDTPLPPSSPTDQLPRDANISCRYAGRSFLSPELQYCISTAVTCSERAMLRYGRIHVSTPSKIEFNRKTYP